MVSIQFISTRNSCSPVSFSQALEGGLAPDGGLYIPQRIPQLNMSFLRQHPAVQHYKVLQSNNVAINNSYLANFAVEVLAPYFAGDQLESHLRDICTKTFDFPIPLRQLEGPTWLLELFHGPTAAFKDVAARFLAECISFQEYYKRNLSNKDRRPRIVLVATSGDTGSAVAAAFDHNQDTSVFILYPKGRVSPRQEQLLTCWSSHVHALAVDGSFDDCQRLVKEALADSQLRAKYSFISANSISVGRLLPQMVYYAWSSLVFEKTYHQPAGFIIPTGNLGNGFAAILAREMGFPIEKIIFATNENQAISRYFESGSLSGFPTIPTLANAMDVGVPSNLERLHFQFRNRQTLKSFASTTAITDQDIKTVIQKKPWGQIFCPHTATAVKAFAQQSQREWILVATAHPAKFETVIEPLLMGQKIPIPKAMQTLLQKKQRSTTIAAKLSSLVSLFEVNLFDSH